MNQIIESLIFLRKILNRKESNKNSTRREFNDNSFERALKLPESIVEDDINALYKDGELDFILLKKKK